MRSETVTSENYGETLRVRMQLIVLAEQVIPVVIAVRRAEDGVEVVAGRGFVGQADRARGVLVVLDQDHRAVDTVVEDAGGPVSPSQVK